MKERQLSTEVERIKKKGIYALRLYENLPQPFEDTRKTSEHLLVYSKTCQKNKKRFRVEHDEFKMD